jgi:hypothetical protein
MNGNRSGFSVPEPLLLELLNSEPLNFRTLMHNFSKDFIKNVDRIYRIRKDGDGKCVSMQ